MMHRHSSGKNEISLKNWKAALLLLIVFLIIINLFFLFYKHHKIYLNVVPEENISIMKNAQFKIIKQEGIRVTNTIRGVVKNVNGTTSDVTMAAKLYYARNVVAEKSVTLYNIKLNEERDFEINFDDNVLWSSFKLTILN